MKLCWTARSGACRASHSKSLTLIGSKSVSIYLIFSSSFKQFYSFRFGNCFALNVDWGTSVALYDEGLNVTTHHHQATMPLTRGLYASRWDPETTIDASLELVLNLNTAEYSWEKTRAVRLFLHPSANVAPTSQASAGGGINLEAGRFYRLATVKSITNLLPAPFATACRNYSGIWERSTRAIQTQEVPIFDFRLTHSLIFIINRTALTNAFGHNL